MSYANAQDIKRAYIYQPPDFRYAKMDWLLSLPSQTFSSEFNSILGFQSGDISFITLKPPLQFSSGTITVAPDSIDAWILDEKVRVGVGGSTAIMSSTFFNIVEEKIVPLGSPGSASQWWGYDSTGTIGFHDIQTETVYTYSTTYTPITYNVTNITNNYASGSINISSSTITITNAEVLALKGTPKTIIAAPGANKIIDLISAVVRYDYNSVVFRPDTAYSLGVTTEAITTQVSDTFSSNSSSTVSSTIWAYPIKTVRKEIYTKVRFDANYVDSTYTKLDSVYTYYPAYAKLIIYSSSEPNTKEILGITDLGLYGNADTYRKAVGTRLPVGNIYVNDAIKTKLTDSVFNGNGTIYLYLTYRTLDI